MEKIEVKENYVPTVFHKKYLEHDMYMNVTWQTPHSVVFSVTSNWDRPLAEKKGVFKITDEGELFHYNKDIKRFMKLNLTPSGKYKEYLQVYLCGFPMTLHTLVAWAFVPGRKPGYVVDHIDHNCRNNRVENLRWVSIEENQHSRKTKFKEFECAILKYSPTVNSFMTIPKSADIDEYARKHKKDNLLVKVKCIDNELRVLEGAMTSSLARGAEWIKDVKEVERLYEVCKNSVTHQNYDSMFGLEQPVVFKNE